jgi:hypothetical protein
VISASYKGEKGEAPYHPAKMVALFVLRFFGRRHSAIYASIRLSPRSVHQAGLAPQIAPAELSFSPWGDLPLRQAGPFPSLDQKKSQLLMARRRQLFPAHLLRRASCLARPSFGPPASTS